MQFLDKSRKLHLDSEDFESSRVVQWSLASMKSDGESAAASTDIICRVVVLGTQVYVLEIQVLLTGPTTYIHSYTMIA